MSDAHNQLVEKGKELATTILNDLDGVVSCKLRELKGPLQELREIFSQLKGRSICDCKTWEQFCKQKLHRTASAVRKLLAEPPAEKAEEGRKSAGKIPVDYVDRAKKQLRQVWTTGAPVEEIQRVLDEIVGSVFPSRRFTVTVEEQEESWPEPMEGGAK